MRAGGAEDGAQSPTVRKRSLSAAVALLGYVYIHDLLMARSGRCYSKLQASRWVYGPVCDDALGARLMLLLWQHASGTPGQSSACLAASLVFFLDTVPVVV